MNRLTWAPLAVAVGLVAGCGDSPARGPGTGGAKDALADLGQMLKSLHDEGKQPPAAATELTQVEPMVPVAGPLLRDGTVVYLWGAGYDAGGNKVVAHERRAATEGGYVLLQDGSVKEMTADEFKAAPKAK